jgi:hypothetical protein
MYLFSYLSSREKNAHDVRRYSISFFLHAPGRSLPLDEDKKKVQVDNLKDILFAYFTSVLLLLVSYSGRT